MLKDCHLQNAGHLVYTLYALGLKAASIAKLIIQSYPHAVHSPAYADNTSGWHTAFVERDTQHLHPGECCIAC